VSLRAQFRLDPDWAQRLVYGEFWLGEDNLGGQETAGELAAFALQRCRTLSLRRSPLLMFYASGDSCAALANQAVCALLAGILSCRSAAQPGERQFLGRVG
jgi:hypothetical protein